MTLVGD
jgi:hypothetical protein